MSRFDKLNKRSEGWVDYGLSPAPKTTSWVNFFAKRPFFKIAFYALTKK